MPSVDLWTSFVVFFLSVVATGLVRAYAFKSKLLDVPNYRSSHQVATPRGGGLGFVAVFLISVIALFVLGRLEISVFLSLLIGGLLVAGVGFVDDHNHVPATRRLLVQIVAATIAVSLLGGLPELPVGDKQVDLGLFGDVTAVVLTVWVINLYNFMDGIDGIAAIETLSIIAGALVLMRSATAIDLPLLLLVFGAAVAGFLVWNWPPAKIFMGDVGSGFLGFVLAVFAIVSSSVELLSIWVWLILSGVFIVDATMTLVIRVVRREKWYSPHNTHAYQKAARRLQGHRPVTIAVFLINMLWLLPIAWLATEMPEGAWWLACLSLAPLAVIGYFLGAGRPDISSEK